MTRLQHRSFLHWLLVLALVVQGFGFAAHQASHTSHDVQANNVRAARSAPEANPVATASIAALEHDDPQSQSGTGLTELCLVCASLSLAGLATGTRGVDAATPAPQRLGPTASSIPPATTLRRDSWARAPPAARRFEAAKPITG